MSANTQEQKPRCELIGQDGNVFNLVGIASRMLRRAGQGDKAKELQTRVMSCGSYGEALCLIGEYVKITEPEEDEEECHDCGVRPGELHDPGCDVEECPFCGEQSLMCWETRDDDTVIATCNNKEVTDGDRRPWTGEME